MTTAPEVLTPWKLNKLVDQILRGNLPPVLTVQGEISNLTRNRNSGHLYFTIKDEQASVDCVMFANRAAYLRHDPDVGQDVLVTGNIGVYVPRGRYQLIAGAIEPVGVGNLDLERRRIEARLREEGLLDPDRKKRLPLYPCRVALVTSCQAAGYADIMKVLNRSPTIQVTLFDVPVQGDQAAHSIVKTLKRIAREHKKNPFDVLLLARGGGSLEDLWAFNDEALARTLASMPMPTMTGIGHEIDVSIADLVADHHAHTPTEAATVIASNWIRAEDLLLTFRQQFIRLIRQILTESRSRLQSIERHELFRKPQNLFNLQAQRLDDLEQSFRNALVDRLHRDQAKLSSMTQRFVRQHPGERLNARRFKLMAITQKLDMLTHFRLISIRDRLNACELRIRASNPQTLFDRGYSITRIKSTGELLRRADQLSGGETLITQLSKGEVESIASVQIQAKLV